MNEDQPPFIPPEDQTWWPEKITDEQLTAVGPVVLTKFEEMYIADLVRLINASKTAAAKKDHAAMQAVRHDLKERESWLLRWSDRLTGLELFSVLRSHYQELEQAYRKAGDDIIAALNDELPGQQDNEQSEDE
jgi:hypothetical protein